MMNVELILKSFQWKSLLDYCAANSDLSLQQALNSRWSRIASGIGDDEEQQNYRDMKLLQHHPDHRASLEQFQRDGMLLPAARSRHGYNIPNPTIFFHGEWQLLRLENPLNGWHLHEVLAVNNGSATNDIFGKLYSLVKGVLRAARNRLMKTSCHIQVFNMNATALSERVGSMRFDRIEVS